MSSHEDMSFFEALKKVIVSPGKVPPASRIVSALEMVDVDIAQREDFNFRWRDYASRDTPTMDMVQVLSVTGMRQADFEKEEPTSRNRTPRASPQALHVKMECSMSSTNVVRSRNTRSRGTPSTALSPSSSKSSNAKTKSIVNKQNIEKYRSL